MKNLTAKFGKNELSAYQASARGGSLTGNCVKLAGKVITLVRSADEQLMHSRSKISQEAILTLHRGGARDCPLRGLPQSSAPFRLYTHAAFSQRG